MENQRPYRVSVLAMSYIQPINVYISFREWLCKLNGDLPNEGMYPLIYYPSYLNYSHYLNLTLMYCVVVIRTCDGRAFK